MTVQCCICKKVRVGDGWESPHEATPAPSNTYCPACFERSARQLHAEQRAYRQAQLTLVTRRAI
jgi:hypothetical protein